MDLYHIGKGQSHIIMIKNSKTLEEDFCKYAQSFYEAAEAVINYLVEDVRDILTLDTWYFSAVYLYRQSLELLLKASIFQTVRDINDRKIVIGDIRHDLIQAFEKLIEIRQLKIEGNKNAEWMMEFLTDISRLDKESDMFRYPFKSDLIIFFQKRLYISLVATHDNMNKAYRIIKEIYDTELIPVQSNEVYPPQLLVEGGDYYEISAVGESDWFGRNFDSYFSAYLEVGSFLKDKIIQRGQANLFLPMCYLYRNAIELGLKRIIVEECNLDKSNITKILRNTKHSILKLWNVIKDTIKKYARNEQEIRTLEDTEQYILAFHNFDPSSDLFRYPCNKKMVPYFSNSKKFDVENVALCFEELCSFLESVDTMLSELRELDAEIASYYDDPY